MKKQLATIAITVCLLFAMVVVPTYAASGCLVASKTALQPGDTFTLTYTVPNSVSGVDAIAIEIGFDNTRFEATQIVYADISPLDRDTNHMVAQANTNGRFRGEWSSNDDTFETATTAANLKLIEASFTVKAAAAAGNADFTVDILEIADEIASDLTASAGATKTKATVNVVAKLTGTIALNGVPAPMKKATPTVAAAVTAPANVTVTSLDWTPAHAVFAGDTVYTATLNVKANTGYVFGDGVSFTVDGVAWTAAKQADGSYNLSHAFPITAGKDNPVYTVPAGITVQYGQKLSAAAFPVIPAGNTPGTWTWVSPDASVGDVGVKSFKATFTPANTADYLTVENIDVPVEVVAKPINILILEIADQKYTGEQIRPDVFVQGNGTMLDSAKDFTVEYGTNVAVGANGGAVTVKAKAGSNYTFENKVKFFNIVRADGKITLSGSLDATYPNAIGDAVYDTHGSDGVVTVYYYTDEACTAGETTVKPVSAGSYWAKAKMAEGTNYTAAESDPLPFTIAKGSVDIPAKDETEYVYDGNPKTYVIAASSLYEVKDGKDTYTNANETGYEVIVQLKDKANYQWANGSSDDQKYTFIIKKAPIVPSVTVSNWTYGYTAAAPELNGNIGNGAVTYEYKLLSETDDAYTTTVPTAAGQYTLRATIAETENYKGSSAAKADFKILARPIYDSGITVEAVTDKIYTGEEIKPEPGVTANSVALVSGTDFTYDYENNVNVIPGPATVKIKGIGNYTGETSVNFTILPADLTLTVNIVGWVVDNPANAPTVTGNKGNGSVLYEYKVKTADDSTYTTTVPTAIGEYTVRATVAATDNYKGGTATDDFSISTKAPQTVTAENVTVTYGDTNKAVVASTNGNGTLSYAVTAGNDVIEIDAATGVLTIKKVGTATVTVTASETNSHAPDTQDVTVTVNKKQIQIPAADTTVYSYTGSEQTYKIPANDAYTVTGNKLTDAGSSTVTVSLVDTDNYEWSDSSTAARTYTFTVNKAKVTAPAADTTVYTYNGAAQTYKIAANSAYTVTGNVQTNANETGYTVTVALKNTANYQWNDNTTDSKTYNFIIKKATITITADDKDARTGDVLPVLGTADYTVLGLANGESLKTLPTIAYENVPNMEATGSYKILVSGAEAPDGGNYNDIVYVSGTLTVSQKFFYIPFAHKITVADAVGGKVAASKSNAVDGTMVQLTVTPDEGYMLESLQVVTHYGKTVLLTAVGNTYTFNMPMDKVTVTASFKKIETPVVPELPAVCGKDSTCVLYDFIDIDRNAWYHDGIHYAVEKGMMNGMGENTFEPDTAMNRAMLLTILWRLEGEPAVQNGVKFTDVADGMWYSKAIAWGAANNIMGGYGADVFGPADALTREQIATVMYRYAQYKGYDVTADADVTYPDADKVSDWALPAVKWACNAGLIGDAGNGMLEPAGSATRAQAATILMRFLEAQK